MSKVLQLFSCSVSLCDTIQLNIIDENRVQGLGVLSGRTGSQIIWPLRLLERHSQVAHTGFYTQCGTGLDNGKKKSEYTLVFTHNAAERREPYEEIFINLYTVWRTCVHVFPCILDEGSRMNKVVWKEPVFYFGQVLIVTRSQRICGLLTKLQ